MDMDWLRQAIIIVQNSVADKLTKDNITVYKVGSIVRIDIKL